MDMATFKNITEEQVAEIAARYGFDWNDSWDRRHVEGDAIQADDYHGKQSGTVHWATDAYGVYQADKLFDGYLAQYAYESDCFDKEMSRFHRDAYGND
jgi:hypothetical protein